MKHNTSARVLSVALAAAMTFGSSASVFASEELSSKWNSGADIVRENDLVSVGLKDSTKAYAKDVTKRLADEGMVLLKNDNNTLPLTNTADTKVAMFGSGRWVSTRTNEASGYVDLKTVMEASDMTVDTSLLGQTQELDADALAAVRENTDTAVIVLQRGSSEGNESSNYSLSDNEAALIKQVSASYDKTIVILNTVCQIASDWILDDTYGVDAVLWAGQAGNLGAYSAVDILTGAVNPSGKLADTWAAGDWSVYPSSAHWGVDEYVDGVPTVTYTDDIYVGYRYFETFNVPVNFAFGYGLSYTTFDWSDYSLTPNWTEQTLTAKVKVTNTGDTAGKDVVEMYYSYPDDAGLITVDTPSIELVQYGKTKNLQPGESEVVSITFDMSDLALYNESSTAWQMYMGTYEIKFGHSVEDIAHTEDFSYASTTSVLGGTLGHKMTPQTEIEVLQDTAMDGKLTINSKAVTRYYDEDADSTNHRILNTGDPLTEEEINGGGNDYTLTQVLDGEITMDEFVDDLSLMELTKMLSGVSNGAPFLNPYYDANGDGEYTFDELAAECNRNINASYTGLTNGLTNRDVYNITLQDRQESVNVNAIYTLDEEGNIIRKSNNDYGFQVYPSSVVIASTWNQDLIEEYGTAIGQEMKEAGMDTWFSPSMNIHRNPAGGRNSEYYSEDPVLTGYSAAACVKGVERLGINVTLKHFAANNQEEQRRQINEMISERALREIYLKGYEIAAKATADKTEYPGITGVMPSYNRINGAWSSENYDLQKKIAQDEWGMLGWAVSDYQMESDFYASLAAGTSVWAPTIPGAVGNVSDEDKAMFTEVYENLKNGMVPLSQVRATVKTTMVVALHVLDQMDGYTVTFKDMNGNVIQETKVIPGGSGKVSVPTAPTVSGYTFTGWDKDITTYDLKNISEDIVVTAQYEESGEIDPTPVDPDPTPDTPDEPTVDELKEAVAEAKAAQAAAEEALAQAKEENAAALAEIARLTEETKAAAAEVKAAQNELKAVLKAIIKISISKKSYTMKVGKKYSLYKHVTIRNASGLKVKYSSSKKSVVSVSSKGVLTAKKKGTATITVKVGDTTKKIRIKVVK